MPQDTSADKPLQRDIDERDLNLDDDDEALFKALEDEDDTVYRAHRIEELNAEFATAGKGNRQATTVIRDSLYPTLKSDQTLLDFTTETNRCIIHFAHRDFARCATMDEHMRALATRHQDVRFARVDVRDTPFVAEKLKIRVLPCVIGFLDGVGVDRVVGFEGLGSGGSDGLDKFSTAALEMRLLWKGILSQKKFKDGDDEGSEEESEEDDDTKGRRGIRTGNARALNDGDDDDDDWN
ncbi:thioredoxin-like protein [Aspergillus lucknowensis]|uniref:Thioredoxin-like protein n=1 Tax=Aspergillus lucknowensis TaxID=176173 RepID=A0ABR4LP46_9EURO